MLQENCLHRHSVVPIKPLWIKDRVSYWLTGLATETLEDWGSQIEGDRKREGGAEGGFGLWRMWRLESVDHPSIVRWNYQVLISISGAARTILLKQLSNRFLSELCMSMLWGKTVNYTAFCTVCKSPGPITLSSTVGIFNHVFHFSLYWVWGGISSFIKLWTL